MTSTNRPGTPRWLTNDEMRLWRSVVDLNRTMQEIEADLKADAGFTFDDYEVLVNLSEAPDHQLRMSELSDRVANSRSRLSQRIDRMSERGLVRRDQCPNDKRSTFAVITDAGLAAIAAAAPDHVESVRAHFFDKLGDGNIAVAADVLAGLQNEPDS